MMALAHTLCPMEGTCIYPSGWSLAGRNPHEREVAQPPIENDHVPGCRDKERTGVTRPTAP